MFSYSVVVKFTCPHCRAPNTHDVAIDDPNWEENVHRISDMYSEDESSVRCAGCKDVIELCFFNHAGSVDAGLVNFPDAEVRVVRYPWDEVPDKPEHIFTQTYQEIQGFIVQSHGKDILCRMLLTQTISALEAYLCDALIGAIRDDLDALLRLAEEEKALSTEKFSLSQIGKKSDIFRRTIVTYLQNVNYHNLSLVKNLYRIALKIDIGKLGVDLTPIYRAIDLRHHCIHRNGFDLHGARITITPEFVATTSTLILELVTAIAKKISTRPEPVSPGSIDFGVCL